MGYWLVTDANDVKLVGQLAGWLLVMGYWLGACSFQVVEVIIGGLAASMVAPALRRAGLFSWGLNP